ncbi:MAG: hypothetical protein CL661_08370 [Bacteroidetes bacterium]|nr:hypothetical protein [Bacteroidota bacterium]
MLLRKVIAVLFFIRFELLNNYQFLYISLGSLSELETQLDICFRLGYIEQSETITKNINHIVSMLSGLIASLKRKL